MKGLWPYVRPYAGWWVASALASICAVACLLVIPRLVGLTIDDLRGGTPPGGQVARYAGLIVLASGVSGVLLVAMRVMAPIAARRIQCDLRDAIFHRLTLLEPAYYQRNRTGDLLTRFTSDVQAVGDLLGFGIVGSINLCLNILSTFAFMLTISVPLGLMVVGAFPVVFGLIVLLQRAATRRYQLVQEQLSELSSRVEENVSGIRLIKASGAEELELQHFGVVHDELTRRVIRHSRVQQPLRATAVLLLNLVFIGALLLIARPLLLAGTSGLAPEVTLGSFVAFITYLFFLVTPLLLFGEVVDDLQRGAVSWSRLRQILLTEPKIGSGTERLPAGSGEVCFEHVTLKIEDRVLLDDVSFRIPAGKTLGVTGRTGSGKSLLASLAVRLLDPTSGRVLINGVDIRQLTLESLRSSVGIVPQEPYLFSRTIAQNIELSLVPDPQRVRSAAKVADLLENVEAFPKQFETVVGQRGVTLSGGQRQRTALARTLAHQTPILILDDALSAVDAETEARILLQLKASLEGRTALLIGHRIQTFDHADEILVLEQGRVIERGSHQELIARNGAYAELDRRQRLAETLEIVG